MPEQDPRGFVTLTLHSHLPYVVNHGTWPHGLEWLCEAAAETYLPLLRIVGELEREGVYLKPNINLSPILLEQLAHPVFKADRTRISIQDVIAAEGPRQPDVDHAQKRFNTGMVVMVEHGKKPSRELIDRTTGIRAD